MLQEAPSRRIPLVSAGVERWQLLSIGDRVLVGLVGAVVVLKVALYLGVAGASLVGDETYYVDAGKALSNAVRDLAGLTAPDTAELNRNVVGSGWFMPGMAVVLAPLFLVAPDAALPVIRGYLGVFSLVLLLVTVLVARRTLGRTAAGALLVLPGLVPMFAVFGMAAWGDSTAGLFVALFLCRLIALVRRVRSSERITWRAGAGVGLLGITAVYFRSSVSPLVGGALAVALLAALLTAPASARRRTFGAFAAAGMAFVAVLLPWSLIASHALDGRVVTTTTVPTVMANTFGDQGEVCFGPCDPGSSIWFSPLRYAREVSRATGVSEVEVLHQMSQHARADVTPSSYTSDVHRNLDSYLGRPGHFIELLPWDGAPYDVAPFTLNATNLMLVPGPLIGVVLLLMVVRRRAEQQLQSLLLKVAVGALLMQPFVHICGSRYWTTMAPVLGLGVALLLGLLGTSGRRDDEPPDGRRLLTVLQVLAAVAAVLVAAGVAVLAA